MANFTASRVSTETVRKLRFFQPHQYLSIDYARQDLLIINVAPGENGDAALAASKPAIQGGEPLLLEIKAISGVRSEPATPPRVTAAASARCAGAGARNQPGNSGPRGPCRPGLSAVGRASSIVPLRHRLHFVTLGHRLFKLIVGQRLIEDDLLHGERDPVFLQRPVDGDGAGKRALLEIWYGP